jgi:hypothetical protein
MDRLLVTAVKSPMQGDAGIDADVEPSVSDASLRPVLDVTCNITPPKRTSAKPAARIYSGPPVTNYIPPELVMRPIRE